MKALRDLVNDALALANPNDTMHGGRLWRSVGGRACPIGWGHCGQPVFEDIRTGATDYGQPGGPGHADCQANCHEGMRPPSPDEDDEEPLHTLEGTNFRAARAASRAFTASR